MPKILAVTFAEADFDTLPGISAELAPYLSHERSRLEAPDFHVFQVLVGSAGALVCLQRVVVAYLNRHKDKKVQIKLPDGSQHTFTGYSVSEFERLVATLKNAAE